MNTFSIQADLMVERLEAESAGGSREPGIDRDLTELRQAWSELESDEKGLAAELSDRIAGLVNARPAAADPAGQGGAAPGEPAGLLSYDDPPPFDDSPSFGDTTPFLDTPPPESGHPFGEEAQATLALQGLEGIETAPATPTRVFEGEPGPEALLEHMGYDSFRPGQREAVVATFEGRDSLIVMPTGGGKSLCYQIPGLAGPGLTLVVSPLIALMADQVRRLRSEGHPAVMFASGLPDEALTASFDGVRDGSARIAYCSPERFASSAFLELLASREVDLLAIDEAHCLSEWGHDFRPDYLRLPKVADRLGRPTVMACTATATRQVADEIAERMGMDGPARIHSGFERPNLSFDTVALEGKGSKARKQALLEHGLADPDNRPAIVYCGTRRDTEALADDLKAEGLSAVAYHAGMPADDRASAQHRFMDGDAEVVVATNAFGMGIDKADVRSVWHWAIPSSVEAYYQEAGRAGRDGAPARAVLLAMRSDLGRLVRFNERRKVDPGDVRSYIESLRSNGSGPTRRTNGEAGRGHGDAGPRNGSGDRFSEADRIIDAPRSDEERIRLAVAERAGALRVDPAPGGRLQVELSPAFDAGAIAAACRVAEDRGWRAYRAVEAFSFSDRCRRRQLLDHFGDDSPTAPEGRCCDVCDPSDWLPDPGSLVVKRSRANPKRGASSPPPELAPGDADFFETLRRWRLGAAGDRPAYLVASNRTLTAIATVKPSDEDALTEISGVGPAFMEKYGAEVLRLVADHTCEA